MDSVVSFCHSAGRWMGKYVPTVTWSSSSEVTAAADKKLAPTEAGQGGQCVRCPIDKYGQAVTAGSPFLKLAGLSGAMAVAMGAYGAHAFTPEKVDLKKAYDTANFYHFIHSLALMAVPLSRRPLLTGGMMTTGMVIFCGTIYYHALTEDNSLRKYTPYGGILLIIAWASMAC